MKVTKLKTIGDGFAYNHYWPMWSHILAEILDCEWINCSLPGLGNEAISNIVLDDIVHDDDPGIFWLIQWTEAGRLDLEINQHNHDVKNIICQDVNYPNNYITTAKNRVYWSSSASKLEFVETYRNLITRPQQVTRSLQCVLATTLALEKSQCAWKYIFTYTVPWIKNTWISSDRMVLQGMEDFRRISSYSHLDIGEIQPVSSIHLEFLETHVLPDLIYDPDKLQQVKTHYVQQDQHRRAIPGFNPRRVNTPEDPAT